MSDDLKIIRGSGNVIRGLGHPDADREQPCALRAAPIIAGRGPPHYHPQTCD